jgi:molybdopterin-guanine dinucleotide biosynthesis protein A
MQLAAWIMRIRSTSLVILAGGQSIRMGFPKHLLPAIGGTITDYIINRLGHLFPEVIVVGRGIKSTRPDVRVVEDVRQTRTPLVGILSGLLSANTPSVFVIGCDMPFVRKRLIYCITSKEGAVYDVVIPVVRGYYEPLCALYSSSAVPVITQYLNSGGSRVTGFFGSAAVFGINEREVRQVDPALVSFINMNTPRDYSGWCSAAAE